MKAEFIKMREIEGVNVLAKGFDQQNERGYVVPDIAPLEVIKSVMAKPEVKEKIKEAGVDVGSMQMIPLQD